MNSEDKIPVWCWLTGQFLLYFEQQKEKDGFKLYKDFLSFLDTSPKMNDFNFLNQGTLLMLCYGLLVYPLESWKSTLNNDNYFKMLSKYVVESAENHPEEKMEINNISELFGFENNNKINNKDLLRHLRNSISHSRVKIDISQNRFIFQDIDQKTKTENFSVKIKI